MQPLKKKTGMALLKEPPSQFIGFIVAWQRHDEAPSYFLDGVGAGADGAVPDPAPAPLK
jgi:hypothetical protein